MLKLVDGFLVNRMSEISYWCISENPILCYKIHLVPSISFASRCQIKPILITLLIMNHNSRDEEGYGGEPWSKFA